ncbi:MAG TPA: hypothetical protein VEB21_08140 [Terriglobales bacterium]|nr:hypothetical protein [Terriglobales bacterium]
MQNVVGIFHSGEAARDACERVRALGVPEDHLNLLLPGESVTQEAAQTDAEQPGVGTALGTIVGGAAGAASGVAVAAALLIPGAGPVAAIGGGAVALLSALGAVSGAAAGAITGSALDRKLQHGLPTDELYVYEDALRQNRSIVLVQTDDRFNGDTIRDTLVAAGAETVDAAREQWWVGRRSAEQEEYLADGRDFDHDELPYRHGFEAAHSSELRDTSYETALPLLRERYPDEYSTEAFRRGFESGHKRRHETFVI